MLDNFSHTFTTPKGVLVYVPTPGGRARGEEIVGRLARVWRAPRHFFHFRQGGHVAAARHHIRGFVFAKLDLAGFFDSVTRSKVHRALRRVGVPQAEAWDIAQQSTVPKGPGRRYCLPFGFVQSPLLAAVALDQSALGAALRTARAAGVGLSVYVDDILVSASAEAEVRAFVEVLRHAAAKSGFAFHPGKCRVAVPSVEAFNLLISRDGLRLTAERFERFAGVQPTTNRIRETAIVGYAASVDPGQADALRSIYGL